MKSQKLGKNISAEVQDISPHGIWLYVNGEEFFLPYDEYPWFKEAKVSEILNLEIQGEGHLYWPDLYVDLDVESLKHPGEYPLVYKN